MNEQREWVTIQREATTPAQKKAVQQATNAADSDYDCVDPGWYRTACDTYTRLTWAGVGTN